MTEQENVQNWKDEAIENMGFMQFHYNDLSSRIARKLNRKRYSLRSNRANYPLKVRSEASDNRVFWQIFGIREYRCLDNVTEAGLIIDCGANVGYASAYFLSRYPNAHVVAVEPDPDNFAFMRENLARFDPSRLTLVNSGVWSEQTGLVMSDEQSGVGEEWGRQVRACEPGEAPQMHAVDIGTLLAESGHERISILKVDIEGSEDAVFAGSHKAWIDRVDNLVIELHGPRREAAFFEAIADEGFEISRCEELVVCQRP